MNLLAPVCVLIWLIVIGSAAYLLLALLSVAAWKPSAGRSLPGRQVCVLKPLCGDEPGLENALLSFLDQVSEPGLEIVFGVRATSDPAYWVARRAMSQRPQAAARIVVDGTLHGANPKVSNLINMSRNVTADVLIVSDSDVVIQPGDLKALLEPLVDPSVGASTALFRGRPGPGTGGVAVAGALYLDGWFLPTAVLHARFAGPQVCFGPLTAIRTEVLDRAGGLVALKDALADDTELGRVTRAQGLRVAHARVVAETYVQELRLQDLLAHELRWAKTIRALQPIGYAASVFMHPGPLPLILALLQPGLPTWTGVLSLLILRWSLVMATRARFGRAGGLPDPSLFDLWWRDQLYFAVWVSGFFGKGVQWRGWRLDIAPDARLAPLAPGEPVVVRHAA